MPELPEVETVVRALAHEISGQTIERTQVRSAKLRTPISPALAKRIRGARIGNVTRRAKYILVGLDNGLTLLLHLGMSGVVRVFAEGDTVPPLDRHDHLKIKFSSGKTLVFRDPRRFGILALYPSETVADSKELSCLGPEPFAKDLTPPKFLQRLCLRRGAIKQVIMDQTLLVGVGNIYASEALFYAGIHPARPACEISAQEASALLAAIRKVLRAAIAAGGSTLRNYRRTDGEIGGFQDGFAVYDREGMPCPGCTCSLKKTGGVQKIVQGGRSSFYCPVRQG